MPFSIKNANKILDAELSSKYMGLFREAPSDDGTHVTYQEVTGTGYARAPLSLAMDRADKGSITNKEIIYFPEAESAWGKATHFGIFDRKTEGEPTIFGALTAPVDIKPNYVPLFRAEQFKLTLT